MEHKRRRNNLYIGEIFYLDAESKEVIASGYGQFDIDIADYQPRIQRRIFTQSTDLYHRPDGVRQ